MSITIDNLTLTIDEAKALKKKLEAAFIVELPEPLFYVSHALHDAECGCGWDGSDILNLIPAPKGVTR